MGGRSSISSQGRLLALILTRRCNTPCAYAVGSVLHRRVEIKNPYQTLKAVRFEAPDGQRAANNDHVAKPYIEAL